MSELTRYWNSLHERPQRAIEKLFALLRAFVCSLRPFAESLTNFMGNDKDHEAGCHSPYPVQMPLSFSHLMVFLSASGQEQSSSISRKWPLDGLVLAVMRTSPFTESGYS